MTPAELLALVRHYALELEDGARNAQSERLRAEFAAQINTIADRLKGISRDLKATVPSQIERAA